MQGADEQAVEKLLYAAAGRLMLVEEARFQDQIAAKRGLEARGVVALNRQPRARLWTVGSERRHDRVPSRRETLGKRTTIAEIGRAHV